MRPPLIGPRRDEHGERDLGPEDAATPSDQQTTQPAPSDQNQGAQGGQDKKQKKEKKPKQEPPPDTGTTGATGTTGTTGTTGATGGDGGAAVPGGG